MLSVSAAADKWAQNMGMAGDAIKKGVAAVTTAPGQLAAQQVNAYLSGVQQNVNKWQTNVAAVPLSTWQGAMVNKGINNIANGINGGKTKWTAAANKWFPIIGNITASLPPRGSLQQNLARAQQFAMQMAQAAGRA